MLLDVFKLLMSQGTRFEQYRVRYADFTDIMHGTGYRDIFYKIIRQPEINRKPFRVHADARDVLSGILVPQLGGCSETFDDLPAHVGQLAERLVQFRRTLFYGLLQFPFVILFDSRETLVVDPL